MRTLRLPAALAVTLLGGGVAALAPSCGGHTATRDAGSDGAFCAETCYVPNANQDPCGCYDPKAGGCRSGCLPCSAFCIPDQTADAGAATCPACTSDGTCPAGCRPVA